MMLDIIGTLVAAIIELSIAAMFVMLVWMLYKGIR